MNAPQKPRSPLKPLDEALADLLAHAQPLPGAETVDTFNADGRVLAQDCVSALHVPPQDNSSMDGYAVRLADVVAAGVVLPVSQRIAAGSAGEALAAGTAARIFTGAPVPEEADAILMRSTDLHGYELPEGIRAIARCGAGVNNIPVEEYAKKGVVVFNSPGANSNAVKELVLGMLVLSSRGVVQSMNWVRDNADDPEIQVDAEKAKKAFVGRELKGKRIGVIGLGNVGSKVANACVDLGMDVYGYDPFISVEHAWVLSREVQRVGTLEDLCRGCDYLTVHVPSKADTIGMISTEQINLLAPNAVLINYARETIIDEDAVDAALREGRLSWFSCDFATPKTVKMPNTFITTHSGAGTGEAEANCADMAISELKDYLENGNIAHSVNYPACSMGKARAASRIACLHANVPNMIGQITAILAKDNANVQRMTNESAGENAYTMFDTDEHLDGSTIEALKQIPSMYRVRVIK